MPVVAPILDDAFVVAFRAGTLTPGQVEAALPRDRAAAICFLPQLSTALGSPAPAGGAHTPPGTVPPYAKPSATPRRKTRGAVPGHPGAARPRPEHIDRREAHQLPACPDCGSALNRLDLAGRRVGVRANRSPRRSRAGLSVSVGKWGCDLLAARRHPGHE